MPQHWVGRSVSLSRWLPAVGMAIVLAVGLVQLDAQLNSHSATASSTATAASAKLSLPWGKGTQWRLTGGPHSEKGGNTRPWSALDFQPVDGKPGKVLAARGGIVVRPCANRITILHADGWATSYYHVKGIKVADGQRVARGQLLGYTSTAAGCGGYATGAHLHFSLLRYGEFVNIRGQYIGGWYVKEGARQYAGCLIKGSEQKCAPHAKIYNSGIIGQGT